MMDGFLVFDNISKRFGSTHALKSLSLSLQQGEIFSLLGPSGCGKTTLLRLAAGFEPPTSGRILLNGRDITALPPEKRPVNTIFQNYALFPHLSVQDNIAFALKMARKPSALIHREVASMLKLVQLEEHSHKRPAQLSGGQRQRVAIARALINRPEVLLLDEPLAALDLKLRQHMLTELSRLHRETGITFLYVTHDQEEAMSLSHRLAVINHGSLQQVGTPQELYKKPKNPFVASFVGDANFLEGHVKPPSHDGRCCIAIHDLGDLLIAPQPSLQEGDSVLIILRPEHLHLIEPGQFILPYFRTLETTINSATYHGSRTTLHLQSTNHLLHLELTNQHSQDHTSYRPGDILRIGFDTRHLVVMKQSY